MLDLSFNGLLTISPAVFRLEHLKELRLQDNALSTLPMPADTAPDAKPPAWVLPKLETLLLQYNSMDGGALALHWRWLAQLPALKTLNLTGNPGMLQSSFARYRSAVQGGLPAMRAFIAEPPAPTAPVRLPLIRASRSAELPAAAPAEDHEPEPLAQPDALRVVAGALAVPSSSTAAGGADGVRRSVSLEAVSRGARRVSEPLAVAGGAYEFSERFLASILAPVPSSQVPAPASPVTASPEPAVRASAAAAAAAAKSPGRTAPAAPTRGAAPARHGAGPASHHPPRTQARARPERAAVADPSSLRIVGGRSAPAPGRVAPAPRKPDEAAVVSNLRDRLQRTGGAVPAPCAIVRRAAQRARRLAASDALVRVFEDAMSSETAQLPAPPAPATAPAPAPERREKAAPPPHFLCPITYELVSCVREHALPARACVCVCVSPPRTAPPCAQQSRGCLRRVHLRARGRRNNGSRRSRLTPTCPQAIEKWLVAHDLSPMTGERLAHKVAVSGRAARGRRLTERVCARRV